jgi:hypothetical protein
VGEASWGDEDKVGDWRGSKSGWRDVGAELYEPSEFERERQPRDPDLGRISGEARAVTGYGRRWKQLETETERPPVGCLPFGEFRSAADTGMPITDGMLSEALLAAKWSGRQGSGRQNGLEGVD